MQCCVIFSVLLLASQLSAQDGTGLTTKNVLFVTFDGLRWEEVFNGAEESLLNKERGGVVDVPEVRKRFWRERVEERRRLLLPFLWGVVATKGQLFGNPRSECGVRVTNKRNFSYPGYNELLTGYADDRIDSNDKNYNPNVTVLEWLHRREGFKGRIAAVTSWEVFPWIINAPRSGVLVNSGYSPLEGLPSTPEVKLLNELSIDAPLMSELTRNDAMTFRAAIAYLTHMKPRVLYVSFDETDAQGHAGRYDRVLHSANKNDMFVRRLWETMQSMPEYAGTTSLVISTDHGRGPVPVEWKNHGAKIEGAEFVWAGVMGPDTPGLGERSKVGDLKQGQTAATIAALLGEDYVKAHPKAAKAFPGIISTATSKAATPMREQR